MSDESCDLLWFSDLSEGTQHLIMEHIAGFLSCTTPLDEDAVGQCADVLTDTYALVGSNGVALIEAAIAKATVTS